MSSKVYDTVGPDFGPTREGNEADASAIIEAIERPNQYEPDQTVVAERPNGSFKEIVVEDNEDRWLPRMKLPGFGEERETCGDDMYRFCACCGESVKVGQTCRQSRCPRCAQEWCREAATSVAAKLSATWAYQYASLDDHPFYHHLVLDVPDDWRLDDDPETVYERTKGVVKEIMDEFDLAGVPIYHPYRGEHEDEEDDDLGEWKGRVFEGREWEDVEDELRFSPHWHVVGVSPYIDVSVTERVHEETGWIIHRITQGGSNVSVGNDFDLARVVSYCLSHCGIYEDGQGNNQAAYYPNVVDRATPEGTHITAEEDTVEEMDGIVRSVAPTTLGVPYNSVACTRDVPEGEGANVGVSVAYANAQAEDGSGEGSGDGSDSTAPDDGDLGEVEFEKCNGRMLDITKAPEYLNDSEWRASATFAAELERRYEEWKRKRGIT